MTTPVGKVIQDHDGKNPWQYSVDTTRQAFWKMVERGQEADIFDLVFSELTIAQCKNINKYIDSKIWAELYLQEKDQ
jgi:hypothetical protein|tara:strand:- start:448 stop:678 length:231 start_codon:yes stop_codon:yes gene_type:complete